MSVIPAPAFIDLHVHLREPGQEYKEDIESGCRAARAGGFGTVFCMPNTNPVNDNPEVTKYILRRANEVGLVKVYPVCAISKNLEGKELVDFEAMAKEGVIAVSDDGSCVQNESLMLEAMKIAAKLDILVIEHAEDFSTSYTQSDSENIIIERDIRLAEKTGARVHIAHISTKDGVDMIRRAKSLGLNVSCEATPHHLLLTENDVARLGANAKMKPPLRTEEDRRALIKALKDGTIDAIATDHAPHAPHEKKDFESAAFGVIGMESAFPACMQLVHRGNISFERLIELFTTGPAKVAHLSFPNGGESSSSNARNLSSPNSFVGDPSITIDPDAIIKIDANKFQSKSRNCPFDGMELKGKVWFS